MTGRHITPGWGLLFVGGVLTVCLFVDAERSFHHSASEAPPQDCALEDDRATASDLCSEAAQNDRRHHAAGETAWPTQC